MGLFNRKRDTEIELAMRNAYNVNEVQQNPFNLILPYQWNMKMGDKDFARAYLWAIIQRIFNCLKNVSFSSKRNSIVASGICSFVERNATLLLWNYWSQGYMAVFYDKDYNYRLPRVNEIRLDQYGRVANRNCVALYSDKYAMERRSDFQVLKPELAKLNAYSNADVYLTSNPAPLAIISGDGTPMNPQDKKSMQEWIKKDFSTSSDDYQFMVSNSKLSVQTIDLPVDKLQLTDKQRESLRFIAEYFQVNPDLILGGSTFDNQNEAKLAMYRDCIQPISEDLLKLARQLYIAVNPDLQIPSTTITYQISNVPELNRTLSSQCEERAAYLDYLLRLREAGCDVDRAIAALEAEAPEMLTEV